jgi:ribosome-binding ATPase YchF (GTP1/OBG family)
MEIGVVGKPNVGKSTFFSASTMAKAEIAAYPFTTIDANRGVAYVRSECPCKGLDGGCDPKHSKCVDGVRLIPVELIDVAGLVPDAHQGKGLGNRFLDDLSAADALIHIVDASGATDIEGNPGNAGDNDPMEEVEFLKDEIALWIRDIIKRDWNKMSRHVDLEGLKVERAIAERLSGLKVTEFYVHSALRRLSFDEKTANWTDDDLLALSREIRKVSKPIMIVANKMDIAPAGNMEALEGLEDPVIGASGEYEFALRKAAEAGLIDYQPGASGFDILMPGSLTEPQVQALDRILSFLKERGTTGVQESIEHVVFEFLDRIVVYPVEDEHHLTDKDGNVLPDAYLMPKGSTARDLAFKVHTDIGEHFIRAINARTQRVMGGDHELEDRDIVKIVAHV